jgi:regulation of enolase protein 1 (concanavalin A-like superfamily)
MVEGMDLTFKENVLYEHSDMLLRPLLAKDQNYVKASINYINGILKSL